MTILQQAFLLLIPLLITTQTLGVPTTYKSAEDEDITLKTVTISSGKDNVQSIYSKPLSEYLATLIEQDRLFEVSSATPNETLDINDLRSQSKLVTDLISKNKSDGLIHLQISKGQMGLHLELGLFTQKSGLIWAYAEHLEKEKMDLEHGRKIISELYSQLTNQVPYQGLILSRNGSKVTINRGALANMRVDQDINVIQIVGVTRHPQFQFVTQVQKEIIGKIRLTKVDETLSFGYILFEKEPQSLQAGLKILLREPVYYPDLATSRNESVVDHLLSRSDGQVIMQGDSKEWLPLDTPVFGRAHVLFGIGQWNSSTNLSTSGGQQASTLMALNAQADVDLWITRSWYLRAGITQGSAQVKNPLSGSTPEKLNFSLQGLKLAAGYDLGISPSIYGARIQGLIGYSQFNAATTESSPTSFTSTVFNGVGFGLSGYMPWNEMESKWGFGAELWYHLAPSVSEAPVSSGTAKQTQIVELSGMTYYHWRPNLYWVGKLSIDTFNVNFSGAGTRTENATSSDFNWMRINGGMEYLF